MEIRKFDVKLNKESVLRAAGCVGTNAVYETASRYFDELYESVMRLFEPYASYVIDGMYIYCVISCGKGIGVFLSELFKRGEAVKGLIADAMADEYLFATDREFSQILKRECAVMGSGVEKRLSAPEDFPLTEQRRILAKTGCKAVTVTDACMLDPEKSMAYVLKLTQDKDVYNMQHDCSKCQSRDCPRRSTPYGGEYHILASHAYNSDKKRDESVVCIDIGTTTVAFEYLGIDGNSRIYKTLNPQRRFGQDVISRIDAANRGRESELCSIIRYTLAKGYNEVTGGEDADRAVIAGNTAMTYLLMNYPCTELGKYPFKAEHTDTIETTLRDVTDGGAPPVKAIVTGGISAYVGGDIVSGLYMCDFDLCDGVNLFIDLGTNAEMALGGKNGITVTSAAAGPAFEGGQISCGTGSVDGAICDVQLEPLKIKTIGDKAPVGICGSGAAELVYEMRKRGILDKTGLLQKKYFEKGFSLTESITFTQNDIRQIQMAKSAVRAGVECLLERGKISCGEIGRVFVAGGFGYGLKPETLCGIGLLPSELEGKVTAVGNSSLGGLVKMCTEKDASERVENIRRISEEFPLAAHPDFERLYISHMNFN